MQSEQILLKLENVSRNFKQGDQTVHALHKTNFEIKSGELVAIIGPSGSGKSTFLTICGGLQIPSTGSVYIKGQDITKLSRKKLAKVRLHSIGFILQASNLVPFFTIEKQLVFIDRIMHRRVDRTKIEHALSRLGIKKLHNKYPSDLSGGERQRAAIAKALYGDPCLILSDEPTASLDTKKAFEVVELLAKLTHENNRATIMVTHDDRLVSYCDSVYEMRDGVLRRQS